MSLFDRDSSLSSSSAVSSDGEAEASLPVLAPPVPPPHRTTAVASSAVSLTNAGGGTPLTPLEQRRLMAEADAAGRRFGLAGAPWRSELLRRPPASTAAAATTAESSKFGASIAAAMNLRKEEKEKMLLRRLQQQRQAETQGGEGTTLAQKDLEVGVFVTASYRAVLQRHIHPAGESAQAANTTEKSAKKDGGSEDREDGEEEDADDPLAAYLRQLEGQRPASSPSTAETTASSKGPGTTDYYDRIMKAPLREAARGGDAGRTVQVETEFTSGEAETTSRLNQPGDAPSISPPTLSELQELIGGPAPLSAGAAVDASSIQQEDALRRGQSSPSPPSTAPQKESRQPPEDAEPEAHSAVLAHARLVYDNREARRRRTATDATVQACAHRCDDRIAAALFCP